MRQASIGDFHAIWEKVCILSKFSDEAPLAEVNREVRRLRSLLENNRTAYDDSMQLFIATWDFTKDFDELAEAIEEKLEALAEEGPVGNAPLGWELFDKLDELLDGFKDQLRDEIGRWPIFIPSDARSVEYVDLTVSQDEYRREVVYPTYLPQLAQDLFVEASRCLAYELPAAALSLSLQATESTIRYYFHRHGGYEKREKKPKKENEEIPPSWSDMLGWLKKARVLPEGGEDGSYYFQLLNRLLNRYRNQALHGRALSGADDYETFFYEAIRVVQDSLDACLRLMEAARDSHSQLRINLATHPDMDFDTVVALFLFQWNPEFPPLAVDSITFDEGLQPREIIDRNATHAHFNFSNQDRRTKCLSMRVCAYLKLQRTLEEGIKKKLLHNLANRTKEMHGAKPSETRTGEQADLAFLYECIKNTYPDNPREVLALSWSMLQAFLASRKLEWNSSNLVEELGLEQILSVSPMPR